MIAAAAVYWTARCVAADAVYPVEKAFCGLRATLKRASRAFGGASARSETERAERIFALEECARIREENTRLRAALGFARRTDAHRIPAEVLSSGGAATALKTIRLDKGAKDGVKNGAAVETPDGLVGRVVDVSRRTCTVLLVTDPTLRAAARIPAEKPVDGIACGAGADVLVLKYATPGPPPEHSKVFTSGAGGVFPAGIAIGDWVDGKIVSSVDFNALDIVFIRE